MGLDRTAAVAEVRSCLGQARERAALSYPELWVDFFALGGEATPVEVQAFLADDGALSRADVNALVQALNEHSLDRGLGMPLPYLES